MITEIGIQLCSITYAAWFYPCGAFSFEPSYSTESFQFKHFFLSASKFKNFRVIKFHRKWPLQKSFRKNIASLGEGSSSFDWATKFLMHTIRVNIIYVTKYRNNLSERTADGCCRSEMRIHQVRKNRIYWYFLVAL